MYRDRCGTKGGLHIHFTIHSPLASHSKILLGLQKDNFINGYLQTSRGYPSRIYRENPVTLSYKSVSSSSLPLLALLRSPPSHILLNRIVAQLSCIGRSVRVDPFYQKSRTGTNNGRVQTFQIVFRRNDVL